MHPASSRSKSKRPRTIYHPGGVAIVRGNRDEGESIKTALKRLRDQVTRALRRGVIVAIDGLGLKINFLEFIYSILDHEHTTNIKLLDLGQDPQWVGDAVSSIT